MQPCIAVNRAQLETTAPISRDELLGLLDAMAETPSTAGGRLFNDVDWDELLTAAVSAMITPKPPAPVSSPVRRSTTSRSSCSRPFAQIAALLPSPQRLPRATRPPPLRVKTPTENKAAQAIADVRARLDTADETASERAASRERVSFEALSPQIVEQLSGEEIAMLPMEMRLTLPEVPGWPAPPRIEITPVPGDAVFIHSTHSSERTESVGIRGRNAARFATLLASLLGVAILCAMYVLL
jgi:hypothetical protein